MKIENIRIRSDLAAEIRNFFISRGHLEVETPLLAPFLIPEAPIEVFTTLFSNPFREGRKLYLTPSPELWMKRLVREGYGSVFQLTKSFRNGEALGIHHNPEFTMLEWYTLGADYMNSLDTTEELLLEIGRKFPSPSLRSPSLRISMAEAFLEYADIDLEASQDADTLAREASRIGIGRGGETGETEEWEDLFHKIFLTRVEPNLPADRPVFLRDYPLQVPCLAREIPGTPWRERWELYLGGVECANCFTEETDRDRVEDFMVREVSRFSDSRKHAVDRDFPEICSGMPECSGVALGFDRLVMAVTGARSIEDVLLFPLPRDGET